MSTTLTHAELVSLAERWLRDEQGCAVVLTEPGDRRRGEMPDAVGWDRRGRSLVVECKVSEADYRADANKPHRIELGLGEYRWYMVPSLLIETWQARDGWGLLYVNSGGQIKQVREPEHWRVLDNRGEKALLVSRLTKLQRQTGKSAQEARSSNRAKLTREQHQQIREYLKDGPCEAWIVARAVGAKGPAVASDASKGLIQGVVASANPPTILALEDQTGDER